MSSQEKPRRMNHILPKITRWRNSRQIKWNSRSCHHIELVTSFPTSQEFCHFEYVWEIYANFIEDAQNSLLHKDSHFAPKDLKFQLMRKWNVWYSIYIGLGGNILPQTLLTCNSKLQRIKLFLFGWLTQNGGVHQKIHISGWFHEGG